MGGRAIKNIKTKSIRSCFIADTVKFVSDLTKINIDDLHYIGSTGKVDISGDIDLAVDCKKYSLENTRKLLQHVYGSDRCVYNPGTQTTSVAIPIAGDESKGLCQVDLMAVSSIDWAKFAYYYAGPTKTQYKGAVRSLLLMGIVSTFLEPGVDHFVYNDQGELIIRAGRTLDLNKGMRRIFQYRQQSASGDRYLKQLTSVTLSQFKQLFPDIKISDDISVINNPDHFAKLLFGNHITANDLDVAERIVALIEYSFAPDRVEQIFKNTAARAPKDKFILPQQILQYQ